MSSFNAINNSQFEEDKEASPAPPMRRRGTNRELDLSLRTKTDFEDYNTYLKGISTGIDLNDDEKLLIISKALSNKHMSLVVIDIVDEEGQLQTLYNNSVNIIRCYRRREKFFEMPLSQKIKFIDIFDTTIGYILEGETEMFHIINVGYESIDSRELQESGERMDAPRDIAHEFSFDSDLLGFKLGHFIQPENGFKKAVMWTEKELYIYPFHQSESEETNQITNNREKVDIEGVTVERIFDFAIRQEKVEEYNDDIPEVLLVLDDSKQIHICKGERYGKTYSSFAQYDGSSQDKPQNNYTEILNMQLVSTWKIVAQLEKDPIIYNQLFEIDIKAPEIKMTKSFEIPDAKRQEAAQEFHQCVVVDGLNDCFFIKEYQQDEKDLAATRKRGEKIKSEDLQKIRISNTDQSNVPEQICGSIDIAKNTVGNNIEFERDYITPSDKSDKKSKGLVFQDFIFSQNYIYLLHGKVISCYDLSKKTEGIIHKIHFETNDFYNFENEPVAIWMMDKIQIKSEERWKIIVYFRNGDIKELKIKQSQGKRELTLEKYLQDNDRNEAKFQGKIVKILRNRNSKNQPVYFIVKQEDGKKVLSTIEFVSHTQRSIVVPGVDLDRASYIILDITDQDLEYQEILCIESNYDAMAKTLEQKAVKVKARIAQYHFPDDPKNVIVLNKETIQPGMLNVKNAIDIFVNGDFVYFVYPQLENTKPCVEKYNILDNSFERITSVESIQKLISFGEFYYWRTQVGGKGEYRFLNRVYFNGTETFQKFASTINDQDLKINEGFYPHLSKIQYDSMSESIAFFSTFNNLVVVPLLHQNIIKVKVEGIKANDHEQILASKLIQKDYILTLHQSGALKAWNLKTGKLLQVKNPQEGIDFSTYVWHQRITDQYTLIREKEPISETPFDGENNSEFKETSDWTDPTQDITMHRYRIVEIFKNDSKVLPKGSEQIDLIDVRIVKSFVGPYIKWHNFSLYVGSELDIFAFYYKDSQEKVNLQYNTLDEKKIFDTVGEETFYCLNKGGSCPKEYAFLSQHSPDFKKIIVAQFKEGQDQSYEVVPYDYSQNNIVDFAAEGNSVNFLPQNLSIHSVDTPNFITNDSIVFLSSDNIVKSYNFTQKKDHFMYTNCQFPGSTGSIKLANLLFTESSENAHLLGQNSLIYSYKKQGTNDTPNGAILQSQEFIAPNNFNKVLFQDINSDIEKLYNDNEINEIKIMQCHYKNKVELEQRGIFGYFIKTIQEKRSEQNFSSELYVISSFTYYHWRIISLILAKKLDPEQLSLKTLKELFYIQLPDGETLLHKLTGDSKYKNELQYIYDTIAADNDQNQSNLFYIPLFRNLNENALTPLDYALGQAPKKKSSLNQSQAKSKIVDQIAREDKQIQFVPAVDGQAEESQGAVQKKAADILLKIIQTYPFDLFKLFLNAENLATLISEDVLELPNLFENLAKSPSFLQTIDRAKLSDDANADSLKFELDCVWQTQSDQQLVDQFQEPKAEEKVISIKVLDLPKIHYDDNNGILFKALTQAQNDELFLKLGIQTIIKDKWPQTKKNVILYLLIPYITFLAVFYFYTVFDFETSFEDRELFSQQFITITEQQSQRVTNILRSIILVFVVYFGSIEIAQTARQGFIDHFKDPWNYLDILPPILILTAEYRNIFDRDTDLNTNDFRIVRTLYSITAFAMWIRLLYFLRIFENTNFYIKMLVNVIFDMGQFLFIFFFTLIAFSHTFYLFFLNHNGVIVDGEKQTSEFSDFSDAIIFSYNVGFGEYSLDNFGLYAPIIPWIFFILQTMFLVVILLNLLISIIGSTYEAVTSARDSMIYRDLVDMIVENDFLENYFFQFPYMKRKGAQKNYLMLVVPEDKEQTQQVLVEQSLQQIQQRITQMQLQQNATQVQNEYMMERLLKQVKNIEESVLKQVSNVQESVDKLLKKEKD